MMKTNSEIANHIHEYFVDDNSSFSVEYAEEYIKSQGITDSDKMQEILQMVDSLGFECECCGWYCNIEQLGYSEDSRICDDCEYEAGNSAEDLRKLKIRLKKKFIKFDIEKLLFISYLGINPP